MNSEQLISLRLSGEVSTKSSTTRRHFQRRLIANIRDALKREQISHTIRDSFFRIDVISDDPKAVEILKRTFGIQSVAKSTAVPYEKMEELVEFGASFFSDAVTDKTFAVRVRRAGDRYHIPFDSPALERALGSELFDRSNGVSLKNPEYKALVEVRKDEALFYHVEEPGIGGLPTGVEGRALVLISGGFDSAVAAWQMLKRGCDLDFVFFNLGGPEPLRHTIRAVRRLVDKWAYGHRPKLHVVDFRPVVAEMKSATPKKFWQVMLKRMMYIAAENLAEIVGKHEVLVTGEAIGQVSSQTLSNLNTISRSIQMPVLRPLVAHNKQEIINLALKIGTHEPNMAVPEFCDLAGGRVATSTKRGEVESFDTERLLATLREVVAQRRVWTVAKIDLNDAIREVRVEKIPENAIVLDLREGERDDAYPNSVSINFDTALEQAQLLPKEGTYVSICELGLKSAYLAELMQRMGYDAWALKRGLDFE